MPKQRLDEALVARGLSASRSRAADAIKRGSVRVAGMTATKPGTRVDADTAITIDDPAGAYVSRAALKLIAALDAFGFDPAGRVALDVGASTGGFTQVLLERGAARVYAVDVGHGQLAPILAGDPNVVALDGVNARELDATQVPEPAQIITLDVSFISQTLVLPSVLALAAPDAVVVSLIKPQFEVGRDKLGKGGIVRDEEASLKAVDHVERCVSEHGFTIAGRIKSPIAGGDGNVEYLIGAKRWVPNDD